MRKPTGVALALLVGGLLALGAPALADHEEQCTGTVAPTGVVYVDANGAGDAGHLTVGSCDNLPPDGHVTVAGSLSGQCGYVVADGDPTNGSQADGHVGVAVQGGTPAVVGPAEGDYSPTCQTP